MRLIDADKLERKNFAECMDSMEMMCVIDDEPTVNAIVIPPNATNGEVMMKVFSEVQHYSDGKICAEWWNELYKGAKK